MEKKKPMPGTLKLHFEEYCDGCDLFEMNYYTDCPPEAGWDTINYVECKNQDICRRMFRVFMKGDKQLPKEGKTYKDIVFATLDDTSKVLNAMVSLIDEYGFVSVADLYDLVGITGNYTDNKIGWHNLDLNSAYPEMYNGGWKLILPEPEEEKK